MNTKRMKSHDLLFILFFYPVIKFFLPIMHSVSIRFRNIVQSSSNLSSIFSYSSHKCQLCHMLFINLVFSLCHFRLISFLTGKRLLSVRYILCILDRESSTLTAASFFILSVLFSTVFALRSQTLLFYCMQVFQGNIHDRS